MISNCDFQRDLKLELNILCNVIEQIQIEQSFCNFSQQNENPWQFDGMFEFWNEIDRSFLVSNENGPFDDGASFSSPKIIYSSEISRARSIWYICRMTQGFKCSWDFLFFMLI